MQHYLRPLVCPESVALVGASERASSLGRTTYENLLGGGFKGALYAVNPKYTSLFGRPSYPSLAAIGQSVELAVIATPAPVVPQILAEAKTAKVKAAVIMTPPPTGDARVERRWTREVLVNARRSGIRVVGAGALGVIRTDIGLDATYCAPQALRGRLAIIAQSGAVATALVDFATAIRLGFSTVISLGTGIDVGVGELLDCLITDAGTDGIVLYLEEVQDARSFLCALRAAARTKPVVVLKAGKSIEPHRALDPDAVFGAALRRAGTVRAETYTQLFSAARILSGGHLPQGDRLAIVSNGRGPALLAADSAVGRNVVLAQLAPATVAVLDTLLPPATSRSNPIDVRVDAPPERIASVVKAALDDHGVDAVLALHVPRPATPSIDVARALADVARTSRKPVLGAWLGSLDRVEVHAALDSGGIADFFTPENAVDAFGFVAAYRRNQALLLETPPPAPEPELPDLAAIEQIRATLLQQERTRMSMGESFALLAAFGIATVAFARAKTLAEAQAAVRGLHFPVTLTSDSFRPAPGARNLRTYAALGRAWTEVRAATREMQPEGWQGGMVLTREPSPASDLHAVVGVDYDSVFGPVVTLRPDGVSGWVHEPAMMLPPLNHRLAVDLVSAVPELVVDPVYGSDAGSIDALATLLTKLSTLICLVPWVRQVELHPLRLSGNACVVAGARIAADPRRTLQHGYRHMAIHPYPAELIEETRLRDGTPLLVRPIRPEDAELEREFVHGLSEETRYMRFFYRLQDLSPAMLARFTQVDYDRELALVALAPDAANPPQWRFVAVARYIANPDRESAEFAVVVGDDFQRRGVARIVMERLIKAAHDNGYKRLDGAVLRVNRKMLDFTAALGFTARDDRDDPEQVVVSRSLEQPVMPGPPVAEAVANGR